MVESVFRRSPLNRDLRPYGYLMEKNPSKLRMRRVAIWTVLVLGYCAVSVPIVIWYVSPSRQDIAFERQLIGKWGMWLAESEMNTPPQRVMEWLPGGTSEHYAPGFKRSLPQPDLEQNWYVRNGILIYRFRTAKTRGTTKTKLNWIDQDNLRLTFNETIGNPTTIYYRRLDAMEDVRPNADE